MSSFWLAPGGATFLKNAGGDLVYDTTCCCAAACPLCIPGTIHRQVQVVTGLIVVPGTCLLTDCTNLNNATFVLTQDPLSGCFWVADVTFGACTYHLVFLVNGASNLIFSIVDPNTGGFLSWSLNGTGPFDCGFSGMHLPWLTNNTFTLCTNVLAPPDVVVTAL